MRFTPVRELLQRPAEGCHAVCKIAALVLSDGQLDMAEHELVIEFGRLGVVFRSLGEFVHDEQHYINVSFSSLLPKWLRNTLSAMVVDVGIIRVVLNCLIEALESLFGIALFHMDTGDLYQALGE